MDRLRLFAFVAALALTPAVASAAVSLVTKGFDGPDLALNITVGGGFIPADANGAIGPNHFATILNGSFAVYDRVDGSRNLFLDDDLFWRNAGASSFGGSFTSGDPHIRYNSQYDKWIAIAFGGDVSHLNIAVSETDDPTGVWRGTTFNAFNGSGGGGIADSPTLAFDRNAVYIGTNNFDPGFQSTTLFVIPLADVFGGATPDLSDRAAFTSSAPFSPDYGFGIQGVNSNRNNTTGLVVAEGIIVSGVGYDIENANLGSGGATRGAVTILDGQSDVTFNDDARQPNGTRTLDAGDNRISGGAYEHDGKIYFARTITRVGEDYTTVRITVLETETYALVQQLDIAGGDFDYYQAAIAVNENGAVVNYNRSGFQPGVGNVSVLANAYTLDANGLLVFDAEHLLKVSPNDGYNLGSPFRVRWGNNSQVTIDPNDPTKFWLMGEYANFRNPAGADGWASWISEITLGAPVPEPQTWAMMMLGFGGLGVAMRRRARREQSQLLLG